MTETLLRGNRRVGTLMGLLALALLAVGAALCSAGGWLLGLGGCICLFGACWLVAACWLAFVPRLSLQPGHLLVYARGLRPWRVPLDVVEVFFIGQGATEGDEPGQPHGYEGRVAANVIVRIAESATQWQAGKVWGALAVWDDGYITVRGLWCENIDQDLLGDMNRKLLAAKRAMRQAEPQAVSEETSA